MSDEEEPVSHREPVPADENDAQRTGTVRCSGWMCDAEAELLNAEGVLKSGSKVMSAADISYWTGRRDLARRLIAAERRRSHIARISDAPAETSD